MAPAPDTPRPPADRPETSGTPGDGIDYHRRRRGRNLALLAVLIAFVALVYVISIVKMKGG